MYAFAVLMPAGCTEPRTQAQQKRAYTAPTTSNTSATSDQPLPGMLHHALLKAAAAGPNGNCLLLQLLLCCWRVAAGWWILCGCCNALLLIADCCCCTAPASPAAALRLRAASKLTRHATKPHAPHPLCAHTSSEQKPAHSLEAVAQHQQQGQALALLVGTGRGLGGLHEEKPEMASKQVQGLHCPTPQLGCSCTHVCNLCCCSCCRRCVSPSLSMSAAARGAMRQL